MIPSLMNIPSLLAGKRTYVSAAGLIAMGVLLLLGKVELDEQQRVAAELIGGGSLMVFLRLAIGSLGAKVLGPETADNLLDRLEERVANQVKEEPQAPPGSAGVSV